MEETKSKLLLLHGALGSDKTFDNFLPLLSLKYEVYTFDFRGHGIYSDDKTLSTSILTNQLIEFTASHKLNHVPVFGYSMGGYMAMLACLKRPELFGKIITLATKFNWDEEIALNEIKQLDNLMQLPEEHPFIKQLIQFHGEKNYPNCLKLTGILMNELGINNYLNNQSVNEIKNKTLLLIGENDTMVSLNETIEISKHLPHANTMVLPNTKHPFEKVNLKDLYMIIDGFLLNRDL